MSPQRLFLALLLPTVAACYVTDAELAEASDRDGDGYIAEQLGGLDCDDGDERTYPGAPESCLDSLDSDCDGLTCPETLVRTPRAWLVGEEQESLPVVTGASGDFSGTGVVELLVSDPDGARGAGLVFRIELPSTLEEGNLHDLSRGLLRGEEGRGLRAFRAGDLDGDGDPDVALSTSGGPGKTILVDALASSPGEAEAFEDFLVVGEAPEDFEDEVVAEGLGYGAVQSLGDRTADGRDDFLLASPGHPAGGQERGTVFLITEPVEGEVDANAHATTRLEGEHDSAWLGSSLGTPGDLDGDGILEAVIGSVGWSSQAGSEGTGLAVGAVYLFGEVPAGVVSAEDADVRVNGRYANSRIVGCHAAGDLDGDGREDLGCGKGAGGGQALFFMGPLEGVLLPEDSQVQLVGDVGSQATVGFGEELLGGFDVDGDGRGDVILSADEQDVGTLTAAGAAFLFHGPLTGVLSPDHAAVRWEGSVAQGTMEPKQLLDVDGSGAPDLLFDLPVHLDRLDSDDSGGIHVDVDPFEALGG